MKIHYVNRTYFAQQIVRCYDQLRLVKESIHHTWLHDEKPINYKISDM